MDHRHCCNLGQRRACEGEAMIVGRRSSRKTLVEAVGRSPAATVFMLARKRRRGRPKLCVAVLIRSLRGEKTGFGRGQGGDRSRPMGADGEAARRSRQQTHRAGLRLHVLWGRRCYSRLFGGFLEAIVKLGFSDFFTQHDLGFMLITFGEDLYVVKGFHSMEYL